MIREKVITPLLQALATGCIIGLVVGLFSHWRGLDAPWITGALLGCAAMAVCWLSLLRRSGGDGVIVSPVEHFADPKPVRVSIAHPDNLGAAFT